MPRTVRRVVTSAVEYGVARAGTTVVRALDRDVVGQAHRPRGAAGRVNGWMFAYRPSNRQRNAWVVSLLGVRPTDRVLEIGFGPGVAIRELVRAGAGHVYGVDHSGVMLRQASRRNAAAIRRGRVTLARASVDRIPPAFEGPFDAVLAVNSLGFWPAPAERLAELRRRLAPGGRIALASQPRCPGATADTARAAAREIENLLEEAGFTQPSTRTLPLTPPVACVLATAPAREAGRTP
ncbi:class I SAM-dependent methyltransferase [Streptomyces hoynatensis]|uniref:Class I SAM-dependent methyltransferase n=1 Tax=Streptomyces hoynatensis TaxID=1141874 RepID=A0A3A9YD91_9ACTN|nr:class I SAM-dependent methyltransferase [Streptomyces hoynatensis]RKN35162.1 class I SAM-dependent methyltransferase [Streptomyces hoynatensis]